MQKKINFRLVLNIFYYKQIHVDTEKNHHKSIFSIGKPQKKNYQNKMTTLKLRNKNQKDSFLMSF